MKNTILIVEDQEKLRSTVKNFLQLYNYEILEAKDGRMALSQFEKNSATIDLILLDIMLPIYDGQYVLKKIREVSDVPVIMITAKAGDYEQIKSFGNGVELIKQIRIKLGRDCSYIKSIYGVGYIFEVEDV